MSLKKLFKKYLIKIVYKLLFASLRSSGKGLAKKLKPKMAKIVPDLGDQYTSSKRDLDTMYYWVEKLRNVHAFQISLVLKAIGMLNQPKRSKPLQIVDIGDSSGNHLIYLRELLKEEEIKVETLSINLDSCAVEKIKAKGFDAICCRAEDLHKRENQIHTDIFLCFETLEHFMDPINFLHSISLNSECEYFIATVPYLRQSQVGLHHLRKSCKGNVTAENTHIFELSPEDWNLIFEFSGWQVVYSEKYTQYPSSGLFYLTKPLWQRMDFEGFYGVVLKKDHSNVDRYLSW